jgi:molybdenum cofactor biosynthesis protein B
VPGPRHPAHPHAGGGTQANVAWLTISDTRSEEDDRSGAAGRELVRAAGHAVIDYRILPDEPDRIRACVREWLARADCDAVLLSGGTGIAARDRTFEAVAGMLDRTLDGFGELFRMLSWEQVASAAMLSRAVGGIAAGKPLFAMPGSTAAVRLALEQLILPELGHLLAELRK